MNTKRKSSEVDKDRITELPEELILNIISRLTLKEAVATSSISTRWTDLWKLYSGCFDFDGSDTVLELYAQYQSPSKPSPSAITLVTKRMNFVDWVNHVLPSHQGTTMKALRIIFYLTDSSPELIDSWVQFALVKRVQFIEFDLTSFHSCIEPSISYSFPIRSHCGFQSLKTLLLKHVNISGDALQSLVDNCLNLEELSVLFSCIEEVVKVSSLSLKQLTLCLFNISLEPINITISAPNLSSFIWTGYTNSNLVLEHVPQLTNVSLYGYWYHIQSHHSQLVKLTLHDQMSVTENEENINIPELSNLKHLKIKHDSINDYTFRLFVAYLEAAPLLENFTLELWIDLKGGPDAKLTDDVSNMAKNHCYKNLKTVEFKGFEVTNDVEFITHLGNHAPLLEKIVIDPCPSYYLGTNKAEYKLTTKYLEARERAINFSASLDCHVTVV